MTPPREPREADNNSHSVARGGASAVKYRPKSCGFLVLGGEEFGTSRVNIGGR